MKVNVSGITLIELIVVIIIISILASFVYPQYKNYKGKSVVSAALSALSSVKDKHLEHYAENGFFEKKVIQYSEKIVVLYHNDSECKHSIYPCLPESYGATTCVSAIINEPVLEVSNPQIALAGTEVDGHMVWEGIACNIYSSRTIPEKYLPASCRYP